MEKKSKTLKAPYSFFIITPKGIVEVKTKEEVKKLLTTLMDSGEKSIRLFKGYEKKFKVQSRTYSSLVIQ